ncbi:alanine racemase [Paracoccus sp. 11-3]|uniref:Alanine racemase n=1 Tax=Paracoccus amoyensis TaxID=2760093 RepID=A0A926G964_9RHOB|nr:alanine racemase [Paracoccus amoyensis]MBC9245601.1 alanine racemase [Paracoccus amoyensis]
MALQIDLSAIVTNWQTLAAMAPNARAAAVVKADAYGLGADRVAQALYDAGARDFFVALASEGRALRETLPRDAVINILSGHMAGQNLSGLVPVLNSTEQFFRDRAMRPGQPFAIQLDTGMNRLGLEAAEWAAIRAEALAAGPAFIMSHLACADEPDHPANAAQLAAFHQMTDGCGVPRSLAATGGILLGPQFHFDMIRPGVGIYGGMPFADAQPVVTLALDVIQTREVQAGEFCGYSATWTAEGPLRIATVAAGYADGILRSLSSSGFSLYAGQTACPVVGRISMDLMTVDVTALATVPAQLDLICPEQPIDRLADYAGTIGYEILTSLGARYSRTYI